AGAVGEPPDSSFDVAARAAGSIVRAHAERGRRVTLSCTGEGRAPGSGRPASRELDHAGDEAAGAPPGAPHRVARVLTGAAERFLTGAAGAIAGGGELVVVTATVRQPAFVSLLAAANRRPLSVVWIDAASFDARPTRAEPGVLRLSAHGVPTAVVRRGDDLAA